MAKVELRYWYNYAMDRWQFECTFPETNSMYISHMDAGQEMEITDDRLEKIVKVICSLRGDKYEGYTLTTKEVDIEKYKKMNKSRHFGDMRKELRQRYSVLSGIAKCPMCRDESTIETLVMHLNDFHEWTREEIANWVDGFEEV